MKVKLLTSLFPVVLLLGCKSATIIPITPGDPKNNYPYGYHPLDPLPIVIKDKYSPNQDGKPISISNERLLNSLPDETIRLAIGEVTANGGISFGSSNIGYEGSSYIVVLDYIKFNTRSFAVKIIDKNGSKEASVIDLSIESITDEDIISQIPVYMGVGLRLTANVTVNEGEVNLGNLFAIGVEAGGKKVSGTLVVQTLGVSGKNISIPVPSELNATTVQNAIMSLAAIKTQIYDDETNILPRVVGVYNTLGGGPETINGMISSILQEPQILEIE